MYFLLNSATQLNATCKIIIFFVIAEHDYVRNAKIILITDIWSDVNKKLLLKILV